MYSDIYKHNIWKRRSNKKQSRLMADRPECPLDLDIAFTLSDEDMNYKEMCEKYTYFEDTDVRKAIIDLNNRGYVRAKTRNGLINSVLELTRAGKKYTENNRGKYKPIGYSID